MYAIKRPSVIGRYTNDIVSRYCADMETGLLYPPQAYPLVKPWNRLFIWRDQVGDTMGRLNLHPAPELTVERLTMRGFDDSPPAWPVRGLQIWQKSNQGRLFLRKL